MSLVHRHKDDDQPAKDDPGYVLHHRSGRKLQPLDSNLTTHDAAYAAPVPAPQPVPEPGGVVVSEHHTPAQHTASNPAVELIRRKLDNLYTTEPDTAQTVAEVKEELAQQRSRHQQYMYELSTSGKSLAEIQTAWHNYHMALPDDEKHEVWHGFYAASARQPSAYTQFVEQQAAQQPAPSEEHPTAVAEIPAPSQNPITASLQQTQEPIIAEHAPPAEPKPDRRSVADVKEQLLRKVAANNETQLKARHHLQSIAFGLGVGALVLLIFLFGFFNEIVIAPFIQPSRHAGATPIILSTDGIAASDTPEVVIPKINVEIPIDYSQTSIDNDAVEQSLDSGVLHYPTTAVPGQQGNAAFFGHSSNNIFNKGKYKFAFVLLHELAPGDVFYLSYNKQMYSYKVYDKKIVSPKETWVLNNVPDKKATVTLITCDPPGTSLNRLVVWGEQISPDPGGNSAAPANTTAAANQPAQLADNGPTLWARLSDWATNLW